MLAPLATFVVAGAYLQGRNPSRSFMDTAEQKSDSSKSSYLTFLGTGSSTGCPKPACLYASHLPTPFPCAVSKQAAVGDPRTNKNYRNNPSLLISYTPPAEVCGPRHTQHVVIDAGKTFRESLIRFLPSPFRSLTAVVLTHEHCDAYGGLDDLRGAQLPDGKGGLVALPVFLNDETMATAKRAFPYLVPTSGKGWWDANDGDAEEKKQEGKQQQQQQQQSQSPDKKEFRMVATLDFKRIEPFKTFTVGDGKPGELKLTPLPVMHGEDCVCLAFVFGEKERVLYMSDVSRIPAVTMDWISSNLLDVDVLVIDCLFEKGKHNTHFCLDDAVEFINLIRPKKAFMVGMSCDTFPEHDVMNERLKKMFPPGICVQFAHDGLRVPVDL